MNQLPDTAQSALSLMPSTAGEVARFSKQLIESVKSGNSNPLELVVQLHALTKVYELVREEIEENILKEADKYPEKVIERYGARMEKAEVGVKYDYTTSRDPVWEQLDSEANSILERKKARETFLKALTEPFTSLNKDTGELDEIRPPVKTSKSGIKIYLASK
jgi:hypothetical protein